MPEPTQPNPDLIDVNEAAAIRGVSRWAIWLIIKNDPKRIGAKMNRRGRWTLSRRLVEAFERGKPGKKTGAK